MGVISNYIPEDYARKPFVNLLFYGMPKTQRQFATWSLRFTVVSLSALGTRRFYHQEIILVLISVTLSRPQDHSAIARIMSIKKKSNDTTWDRTSDLPI